MSNQQNQVALDSICSINPPLSIKTSADMTVTYLPMEHIAEGGGQLQAATRRRDAIPNGLTPFQEGDVLIAKITPCFENMKGWLAQGLSAGVGFGSTELHVIRAGPKVLPRILYAHSLSPRFRRLGARFMTGSAGQQRVSADFLRAYRIWLPSLATQHRIADIDQRLEGALRSIDALIAAKREQKRGLMQQLLTGKVRFPGFTEPWKTVRIGDIAARVTRRNRGASSRVLTASGQHGLIDQREFFSRRVASAKIDEYYLMRRGEFAYNRSAMQGYDFGAIKRLDRYDEAAISTLYICFAITDEHVQSDFLAQVFESRALDQQLRTVVRIGIRDHGLLNLDIGDFFEMSIRLPSNPEQRRIAECLYAADREIQLLEEHRRCITNERRGLMERLLSGDLPLPSFDTSAA